ncbi:hypothetical protein T484DRAFT_1854116 [Baffinella frigidus]|nr:hypothetical protein T484DRAFT_1854116 [Cryptophyta sp. CCMP2293]
MTSLVESSGGNAQEPPAGTAAAGVPAAQTVQAMKIKVENLVAHPPAPAAEAAAPAVPASVVLPQSAEVSAKDASLAVALAAPPPAGSAVPGEALSADHQEPPVGNAQEPPVENAAAAVPAAQPVQGESEEARAARMICDKLAAEGVEPDWKNPEVGAAWRAQINAMVFAAGEAVRTCKLYKTHLNGGPASSSPAGPSAAAAAAARSGRV